LNEIPRLVNLVIFGLPYSIRPAVASSVSANMVSDWLFKHTSCLKPAEIVGLKAGKEYYRKTKRPDKLWMTDCTLLKVIDWGWYYMVTVMDDFSRFILA
jgi:putative transposase